MDGYVNPVVISFKTFNLVTFIIRTFSVIGLTDDYIKEILFLSFISLVIKTPIFYTIHGFDHFLEDLSTINMRHVLRSVGLRRKCLLRIVRG